MTLPIGILGGTFDPVHFAHLRLAKAACAALGLAEVRLIPAGDPYHREPAAATAEQRLEMLRRAIAGHSRLTADDRDLRRSGPTYTVDTLNSLRADLGEAQPLVLLLGADAFLTLESWRDWRAILDLAHVAVASRPSHADWRGAASPALAAEIATRFCPDPARLKQSPGGSIVSFAMTPLDISATRIRQLLAEGQDGRDLLPQPVLDYIEQHHLYTA